MFDPIKTSVFELFKIGPGPSSSHTIGPMKAGYDFLQRLHQLPADRLVQGTEVRASLFGSLSATGRGHGTDRAIAAGLLGWTPESVDPEAFDDLFAREADSYPIPLGARSIPFAKKDIRFGPVVHDFPFNNTLILQLYGGDQLLHEMEYYSVGGGFIQWKGWQEQEVTTPPFPYRSMNELKAMLAEHHLSLYELLMANEQAISGLSEDEIEARLDHLIHAMFDAVSRGIQSEGTLPGGIHLERKARRVFERAKH